MRALPSVAALALILSSSTALAQTTDRERLIDDAMRARESGDHATALEAAQRAGQSRMTPSLRQFITEELRAVGRYEEALQSARLCVGEAETQRHALHRRSVLRDCRRLAEELEQRAREQPPAPPVTPPAPPVEPPPTATAPSVDPPPPALAPPSTPHPITPTPSPARGPSVGPFIVGGVGAAMLGGALATFLMESSLRDEQQSLCVEDQATQVRSCAGQRGVDISAERDTLRVANYVLFFGGVAAVGTAVVWFIVDRASAPRRVNVSLSPRSDGWNLGVTGRF